MNLLLGVGEPRLEGWEGYQYVVNREKGIVSRLDEKGNLTAAGEARLCQRGSQLAVEVPLSALGTDAPARWASISRWPTAWRSRRISWTTM